MEWPSRTNDPNNGSRSKKNIKTNISIGHPLANIIQRLYMDNITIHTSTEKIKKLYGDLSYFDQYGGSVFLFFFLTIVVFFVSGYFFMKINVATIKADWVNQRCNPSVIPFAGFINKPADMTALDFTEQNFAYCTDQILIPITLEAVNPFSYIVSAFLAIYTAMAAALNAIREVIDKIRKALAAFLNQILGRLTNFIIPIIQLIIAIKDNMAKVVGVMTTSLYMTMGAYSTLKSMLGSVLEIAIIILIALVAAFVPLFVMMFIPFLTPFAIAGISILTVFYVAITVVLLVIVVFLNDTMGVTADGTIPSLPPVPVPPSCFDKHIQLRMLDGTYKSFEYIKVGDELSSDGKVTAKLKLDASNMNMYNLNGVVVSGCHRVYLEGSDTWIKVEDHCESVKLDNYEEPYIYCINTESKVITIQDHLFLDWDEVPEYLNKDDKQDNAVKAVKALDKFHRDLDSGFAETTKIKIKNGSLRCIKDIKVDDILLNGEKVYGIVEIDGSSVSHQYWYTDAKAGFIGGPNLQINKHHENLTKRTITGVEKCNKLYHLLTDKKKFQVGNLEVFDYNASVDIFLRGSRLA